MSESECENVGMPVCANIGESVSANVDMDEHVYVCWYMSEAVGICQLYVTICGYVGKMCELVNVFESM